MRMKLESKEEEKRMLRARRFEKRRCAILRDEADVGSGERDEEEVEDVIGEDGDGVKNCRE